MKTVTILLTMISNPHGIIHMAEYETPFTSCYTAELYALDKAYDKFVVTGEASEVSIHERKNTGDDQ